MCRSDTSCGLLSEESWIQLWTLDVMNYEDPAVLVGWL